MAKKLFFAADHAGVEFKKELQKLLPQYEWVDLGPDDSGKKVDYVDYAEKLGAEVLKNPDSLGILACGTGVGMSVAANKINGIRAALVSESFSAQMTREHNNSNVLCLAARILSPTYAAELVKTFVETPFSNDKRHLRRIEKLKALESKN